MPKQPPYGGKKKNPGSPLAAAQRQTKARKSAGSPMAAGERERFKQFGDFLAAKDVSGKGRSAAAGRRQGDLKKYVSAVGAAGIASGMAASAKKKSAKKVGAAAAEVRAAKNAKMKKKRVPKTM